MHILQNASYLTAVVHSEHTQDLHVPRYLPTLPFYVSSRSQPASMSQGQRIFQAY